MCSLLSVRLRIYAGMETACRSIKFHSTCRLRSLLRLEFQVISLFRHADEIFEDVDNRLYSSGSLVSVVIATDWTASFHLPTGEWVFLFATAS
jgi:hypothetical protein